MLPRGFRLRNRADFRAVYFRPKTFATSRLVLHLRPRRTKTEHQDTVDSLFRVGFSISKKTAKKAHDRNMVKRRLSEIVRTAVVPRSSNGERRWDVVIQARSSSVAATYSELQSDVVRLFMDAALIGGTHQCGPQ